MFSSVLKNFENFDFEGFLENQTNDTILNILNKEDLNEFDFLALLSQSAKSNLKLMAEKAFFIAKKNQGSTILLYTPLYIDNHCENECVYCSFNLKNKIKRKKLNFQEIEKEAIEISKSGISHILLLTGESKNSAPIEYIKKSILILKKYFECISIEIYPIEIDEYLQLVEAGVSGLTIYQEVYNPIIYDKIHLSGPKKNYDFRLNAPERGSLAGMKFINIGALLGLDNFKKEAFFSVLHLIYLKNKYPHIEFNISFPRIRPHIGVFEDVFEVNDLDLIQLILAFRIFDKKSGITLSTRESINLRNALIPFGITNVSAGVLTNIGGHSSDITETGDCQFEINDNRSVGQMFKYLKSTGFEPIFKNWMYL